MRKQSALLKSGHSDKNNKHPYLTRLLAVLTPRVKTNTPSQTLGNLMINPFFFTKRRIENFVKPKKKKTSNLTTVLSYLYLLEEYHNAFP